MPAVDEVLDGYRLIRLIGSGGFGDVWLCQMESTGEYRALKFVPQDRIRHLDRELQALRAFRREIEHGATNHLVSIEHINRCEAGLFYVMPLADGPSGLEVHEDAWKPLTLEAVIANRRSTPRWLTVEEIVRIFGPLALAAQALSDAGLVHRDIKPQNILFFGGLPRLADIGLVSVDDAELSEMGTPGYVAPQWYLAAHGNPDMWGLAATLYHCATGNHPDYMSRPAYRWPPSGKEDMTSSERQRWLAMLGVAYRATQENPTERYIQFRDMANALDTLSPVHPDPPSRQPQPDSRKRPSRVFIVSMVCLTALVLVGVHWYNTKIEEIANFPIMTSESGAHPVNTPSSVSSSTAFKIQLKAAESEFEELIHLKRNLILHENAPTGGDVTYFHKLLLSLATKADAPMGEIRRIFELMCELGPGVDRNLSRISDSTLTESTAQLCIIADRPRRIAKNAEEVAEAGDLYAHLLAEVRSFQSKAMERNHSNLDEASALVDQLKTVTNKLVEAREKVRGSEKSFGEVLTESNEIYHSCEEVDESVLEPILIAK